MWSIAKPACSASDAYEICISRVKNKDLKGRFKRASEGVEKAASSYDDAGVRCMLSSLNPADFLLKDVSSAEMMDLYSGRMVPLGSPGRAIYDEIKVAAKDGRCPLCGHRDVMTVDHYLPKTIFPAVAVYPANLVPACRDCNSAKADVINSTLHPYYDDVTSHRWLRAEVLKVAPVAVRYSVNPADDWPVDPRLFQDHEGGLSSGFGLVVAM